MTEIHEDLHLDETENTERESGHDSLGSFGIFSVKWSSDTQFLCAGTGHQQYLILLYDVQKQKVRHIDL